MKINGISNNVQIPKLGSEVHKPAEKNNPQVQDKIEISNKAKILQKNSLGSERLEQIRGRIENGFYDSDEVLSKVAEKILKEIG